MTELVYHHQGMIIHHHVMETPEHVSVAAIEIIDLHNRQREKEIHPVGEVNLHNQLQEKELKDLHHHILRLLPHVQMKDRDQVVLAVPAMIHVQAVALIAEGDVNKCIFKKFGGGIQNENLI
ncbi:MAG: hypothetical protein D4R68_04105 [Ignavibacteriales bacterium]|nr:MAG: hypothetical protein D4R68_04105 [Ignavibacteriales bacterium]